MARSTFDLYARRLGDSVKILNSTNNYVNILKGQLDRMMEDEEIVAYGGMKYYKEHDIIEFEYLPDYSFPGLITIAISTTFLDKHHVSAALRF